MLGLLLAQLRDQVGEHAAGNLRYQDVGLDPVVDRALELGVFAPHPIEVLGDLAEQRKVEAGVVRRPL